VHGHELEAHRRTALQRAQDVQHRVGILAAGHADHDAITVTDHGVVDDRLSHLASQAFLQLVELCARAARVALHGLEVRSFRGANGTRSPLRRSSRAGPVLEFCRHCTDNAARL
jgi:hypothetical protein